MLTSLQTVVTLTLFIVYTVAEAPPGYVKPKGEEPDKNPPKYEYGYKIQDEKGAAQGKSEVRDGIYAMGRYYVEEKDSNQNVKYYADDWGFHPYVEYTSVGPHSRSSTQLLLGVEAIKKFKNNQDNTSPKEEVSQTIDSINQRQQTLIDREKSLSGKELTVPTEAAPTTVVPSTERHDISTTHSPQQDDIEGEVRNVISQILSSESSEDQLDNTVDKSQSIQGKSSDSSLEQSQVSILQPAPDVNSQSHTVQPSTAQIVLQQQQNLLIDQTPQPLFYTQQVLPSIDQQNVYTQQPEYSGAIFGSSISTLEPQQLTTLSFSQPLQQNYILHFQTKQSSSDGQRTQQELNTSENEQETAAVFEASREVSSSQNIEQASQESDSVLENQFIGNFGTKVGVTPSYILQNTIYQTPNKLIETTKNLVSGQDVLNINGVIGGALETHSQSTNLSQTTYSANQLSHISQTQQVSSGATDFPGVEIKKVTVSPTIVTSHNEVIVSKSDDNAIKASSNIEYHSSSTSRIEESNKISNVTEPSPVLVTPKPISVNFLAPITAGIQLQNIEYSTESKASQNNKNVQVEVQESIPYYLGMFEYPSAYAKEQYSFKQDSSQSQETIMKETAVENIELGKTLLYFPEPPTKDHNQYQYQNVPKQQSKPILTESSGKYSEEDSDSSQSASKEILEQKLPSLETKHKFATFKNQVAIDQVPLQEIKTTYTYTAADQESAQDYNYQVAVQQLADEKPISPPITQIVEKPVPVHVKVPYPVENKVPVPVTVEKIIEKPVTVTKFVEKPVPVPQPYPVEKIVERPVHVPVEVPRIIEKPYPVEKIVEKPVPYPVERIVEKPVHIPVEVPRIIEKPYPVEVRVPQPVPYPVEKIVRQPYPVHVPVEIKVPVEKIVEKPVHVTQYIDRPVPVQKIVEKPVIQYVDRPYPVEVKVPVHIPQVQYPQAYLFPVQYTRPYNVELPKPIQTIQNQQPLHQHYILAHTVTHPPTHIKRPQPVIKVQQSQNTQQQGYHYPNPYSYAPTHINTYLPPKTETASNGYLPPKNDQRQSGSYRNLYFTIKHNDYMGLLPPKVNGDLRNFANNFRKARSNFNNLRIEYGFMPPLIPSLEIDENGKPVEKTER